VQFDAEAWEGDYGNLSARIARGINNWDLVHVEAHYVRMPQATELFESYPQRSLVTLEPAFGSTAQAVPVLQYAYVLAYLRNAKTAKHQIDWRTFWDVKQFPGNRAVRDFPVGNIEIALMSEGLDVTEVLYKRGLPRATIEAAVDRALHRLDQLKLQIVWWSTGDQLQRGLTTGDTPFAAAWSGRVLSAHRDRCATAAVADCDVQINPATALVSTDSWIIPKNARNATMANSLLECLYRPNATDGAKAFSEAQGYAVGIKGMRHGDPVVDYYLKAGSALNSQATRLSEEFWGANYDWIADRWRLWRAAR
jgi:putative spermidine/putrescine transport system substrate-binding protein